MERVVPGKDLGRQAIFDPLRGFCPRQEIVALRQPIQRVVTSQSSKHLLFVSATTGFHTHYKRLELALASPRIWATSQQRHEEAQNNRTYPSSWPCFPCYRSGICFSWTVPVTLQISKIPSVDTKAWSYGNGGNRSPNCHADANYTRPPCAWSIGIGCKRLHHPSVYILTTCRSMISLDL